MKNIWKLLLIAMMAIAMVGCPQPSDDDDDDDNSNSFTSFDGVYSYSDALANISKAWGGSSAAPAFSIVLMDQIAIDSMKEGTVTDLKNMAVGSPVYQIQAEGNGTFLTAIEGSWKTKYDGVAATVDAENYTLFVDGSKIRKTQLKGIGKDFGTEGEKVMTDADSVDLTGYQPVTLALTDNTTDDGYIAALWNAGLYKMTKGGTYPDAKDTPALVKFSIKFTGTSHIDPIDTSIAAGTQNVDWTVSDVEYYTGAKVPFNFFADNSGTTNEVAAAGATLTATLTAGEYDWEASEAPNDYKGYKIAKKCNIGTASDVWLGFDALISSYKMGDTKASGDEGDSSVADEDSSVADSSEADSSEADSSVADSSEADSSVADSSEADSSEADSSVADSSEADSSEADSSVADSSEADSSEADSSSGE